jgi:hypothetical protein
MSPTAEDTRFGTSLPAAIQRRLRLQAAATGTKMAPLLAEVLDKALMSEAELAELIRTGGIADDHAR